ncbi:MAG: VanZ family protein [Pseudomonadota bacterium]
MDVSIRWLPAAVCVSGIFAVSHIVRPEEIAPWCSGEQKEFLCHLGLYALLGFFTAWWLSGKSTRGYVNVFVLTVTACVFLGICDEVCQMFVQTRSSSVHDVGLDLLGGTVGALTHGTVLGPEQPRLQPLRLLKGGINGRGAAELAPPKRKIPFREFVADFQAGMTDTELIDKYRISPNQLKSIFKRLLDRRIIDPVAFEAWQIFGNSHVPLDVRKHPRIALASRPPIYEAENPDNRGVIINVSAHGLAVRGLRTRVDEMMTLIVPRTRVSPFGPITIDVRCRWTETGASHGRPVGGFYVVVSGGANWDSICRLLASYGTVQA